MYQNVDRCPSSQPQTPVTYHSLTVPSRLLTDLSDSPLAVGLYGLVARLFLVNHIPIPLSTGDVQRYDPSLSRSAIMRAFARLVRGGWVVEHTRPGCKTSYAPAWGFVNGAARAWLIGAPLLARPRRTLVVLLQKRLLDTCIGKLVPHPTNPATVERYLTQPLLGIADVGTYLLLDNGGCAKVTKRLLALELIHQGRTRPLAEDTHLLAWASQRGLFDSAQPMELTQKGLLKLGCPTSQTRPEGTVGEQPLFFVPPAMFGSLTVCMDSHMIGLVDSNDRPDSLVECAQTIDTHTDVPITWIKGDKEKRGNTTTPATTNTSNGGGINLLNDHVIQPSQIAHSVGVCDKNHDNDQDLTETASSRLLQSLHVSPKVIAEFAHHPLEHIQAAIADGQGRSDVRDLAGWVVARMRRERDQVWSTPIPSPKGRSDTIDWTAEIAKARANGLIGDSEATSTVSSPLTQEHPHDDTSVAVPSLSLVTDAPTDVCTELVMHLHTHLPELLHPIIARLTIHITDDVVSLVCRQSADVVQLQRFLPTITTALCRLGWLRPPQLVGPVPPPACVPEVRADACPDWTTPARWVRLPALLRAALHDAVIQDGTIQVRSPYLTRLLETRYPSEIQELRTEVVDGGEHCFQNVYT